MADINSAGAAIALEWDTEARDEILNIARQDRDSALAAGDILRMLENFATDGGASVPCKMFQRTRVFWWPDQAIKAFFVETTSQIFIAHVAITNTPYELEAAQKLAYQRYQAYQRP